MRSISLVRPLGRLCVDLVLEGQFAILFPVFAKDTRQTPPNPLLIQLVLGILASRNVLGQGNASSENAQVCDRTGNSPIPPTASSVRSPDIESNPDGLLGGEVGVARELPQSSGVEAAVELRTRVAWLRLSGALVSGFCGMEVPLLSVGEPLNNNEDDEEAGEDVFDCGHGRVEARGQEEDVGGRCHGEEEDLMILSVSWVSRNSDGKSAYTLDGRSEEDVQQEEGRCSNPALDQIPTVVLATDLVTSSAPVVEGQAQCPQNTECHHVVHPLRLQGVHPSPHGIMDVVEGGEDGPHAVDLAPVPVDFGDDEEDWEEREGEGEAGDDGVGRGVDIFQGLEVSDVGDDLVGQRVQLGDVRLDCLAVRGAIGERLDHRHRNADVRGDEHLGGCIGG